MSWLHPILLLLSALLVYPGLLLAAEEKPQGEWACHTTADGQWNCGWTGPGEPPVPKQNPRLLVPKLEPSAPAMPAPRPQTVTPAGRSGFVDHETTGDVIAPAVTTETKEEAQVQRVEPVIQAAPPPQPVAVERTATGTAGRDKRPVATDIPVHAPSSSAQGQAIAEQAESTETPQKDSGFAPISTMKSWFGWGDKKDTTKDEEEQSPVAVEPSRPEAPFESQVQAVEPVIPVVPAPIAPPVEPVVVESARRDKRPVATDISIQPPGPASQGQAVHEEGTKASGFAPLATMKGWFGWGDKEEKASKEVPQRSVAGEPFRPEAPFEPNVAGPTLTDPPVEQKPMVVLPAVLDPVGMQSAAEVEAELERQEALSEPARASRSAEVVKVRSVSGLEDLQPKVRKASKPVAVEPQPRVAMPSEQPVGGSSDARPEQGGGTALSSLKRWFGLSSDEKDVVATDKGGLPAIKANDYGNLDIPPEEATARGRQSPAVVGRGCAIQLAASSQRHGLDQLVSRYGLGNKAWVITETRAGRPWYSLMYGRYEDASDALAEMKALPEGLSTAPWVRTLKGQ